jgi:hypothetical protein
MREAFFNPQEDRFIRGIIDGTIAGVIKDIPVAVLELIWRHPHPTYWDYMSLLTIGHLPRIWSEYLLALIAQVMWSIFLAIVFVYLQPRLKSKHYLLQGSGFGVFIWLFIRATVYFFRSPELVHSNPLTALFNATFSALFGMTVAFINHKLSHPRNS